MPSFNHWNLLLYRRPASCVSYITQMLVNISVILCNTSSFVLNEMDKFDATNMNSMRDEHSIRMKNLNVINIFRYIYVVFISIFYFFSIPQNIIIVAHFVHSQADKFFRSNFKASFGQTSSMIRQMQ